MPLRQDDPSLDYDGSWGDASIGWPHIAFPSDDEARHACYIGWKYAKVPYGSYVLVKQTLRLENQRYIVQVQTALKKHPYKSDWKDHIRE